MTLAHAILEQLRYFRLVIMESSDAEQSVRWTCSVTVKCEPVTVKEEPQGGECGVSEAAVAGLYAGHEVKDEIVIGPETVQQQDVAFSMQNDLSRTEGPRSRKPERDAKVVSDCIHTCPGDDSCCNRSTKQQYGLRKCSCNLPTPLKCHQQSALNSIEQYPSKLQRAGGASLHSRPGEESRCDMSHKQQFQLRSCSVRLERILMEDLPTCNTYLEIFNCKSTLRNHSCTHSIEEPNYYKDYCDKQYLQVKRLGKHLAMHHVKTDSKIMNIHSISKKPKLYNCDRSHTGEKPYSCDNRKKIFRYPSDFAKQKDTDTRIKSHSCRMCNKQFTYKSYLNKHMRIHMDQKQYSCDICKKKFTQKCYLIAHIRIHTGKKPFSCDVCKLQFTRKDHLIEHKRTHTGEKPFTCDVCKSQFARKDNLARHKRTHTGEKPFSCDVCELQFSHTSNLAVHRRTHTGEKPFSCELCKLRFTHKSDLAKHRRTHSGEKLFSCDICKLQFARNDSLAVHRRIHTGEKPFTCNICNTQFARSDTLAAHRRIHTGEKLGH
ncbi:uncharacterized protein [Choristoneura fumiferana]|uniref:uncharacterized protein n=1 Tax=Choristoneura fumiferana TaxID=7141 RepID=UPI003D15DFDC